MDLRSLRRLHSKFKKLYNDHEMNQDLQLSWGPPIDRMIKKTRRWQRRERYLLLADLESVTHEFAHMMAQGVRILGFPKRRLAILAQPKVSEKVSDALEVDATAITLLVGIRLGWWTKDRIQSAQEVLETLGTYDSDGERVREEIMRQLKDPHVKKSSLALARWFDKLGV